MATLVEEVLAAWRDAERVVSRLPELDADHETVARTVAELRALYGELTTPSAQSRTRIRASTRSAQRTRALLERARRAIATTEAARDGGGPPIDPGAEAD